MGNDINKIKKDAKQLKRDVEGQVRKGVKTAKKSANKILKKMEKKTR